MIFRAIVFFIIFLPVCLSGQISLRGKIIDVITDEPIPFATVYIDGTTNGTITDSAGYYKLDKLKLPCQVIYGHTSYFSKLFLASPGNLPDPVIFLTPKDIGVNEVTVSAKNSNLREKNLKLFKEKFLGDDRWGLQAVIENEDVLRFQWEYDTMKLTFSIKEKIRYLDMKVVDIEKIEDTDDLYSVPIRFTVTALNPLKIVLPLTGYHLTYDLQEFRIEYSREFDFVYWRYTGYSFYNAIEPKSNTELFKYKRNRLNVYYNSPMHLLRAMYHNKLRQNGYAVVEMDEEGKQLKPINTDSWIFKNNTLTIPGNKGKNFYVMYFSNINGEPTNLEKREGAEPIQSQIYFMSDTCVVRENGTLVDNSILFRPFMGTKQIGTSLPSDFKPGPGRL